VRRLSDGLSDPDLKVRFMLKGSLRIVPYGKALRGKLERSDGEVMLHMFWEVA